MVTVLDALKGITAYPIPVATLSVMAVGRGLLVDDALTREVLGSKAYRLTTADAWMWLSEAPDLSQGGISYSLTDDQRFQFRNRAYAIYAEWGEENSTSKTIYGYKGSRL